MPRDVQDMSTDSSKIPLPGRTGAAVTPYSLAAVVGGLVCLYGVGLSVLTGLWWAELQPPGTTIAPLAIQSFVLRIEQGIYIAVFGGVLCLGSMVLGRRELRASTGKAPVAPSPRGRVMLVAAAAFLIGAVPVLGFFPPPQSTLGFRSADFHLAPSGADGPFEIYLVSNTFSATAGQNFFPVFGVALRDNRSGTVVAQDDFVSSYVKADSDPFAVPQFGGVFGAASNGAYVVVVRNSFCETLASPPCANATVEVWGNLTITSPAAYVPPELGFGIAGSAFLAVAAIQPGFGHRRMTP